MRGLCGEPGPVAGSKAAGRGGARPEPATCGRCLACPILKALPRARSPASAGALIGSRPIALQAERVTEQALARLKEIEGTIGAVSPRTRVCRSHPLHPRESVLSRAADISRDTSLTLFWAALEPV